MSKSYTFVKETPIIRNVDVLVVGGGPAGICGAIAAARNGAKTLLVEKYGCVGGMATVGLVGPFMTCYDATGELQVIRGIFDELIRRMEKRGGAIHPSKVRAGSSYSSFTVIGHDHVTPFDSECMKIVAAEMIIESGAELLLHTQFLDTIMEQEKITGIVVANKSGIQAIKANVTIDCTGDGDVSVSAGAPYVLGTEDGNKMQPATMFFRICNVDSEKVKKCIEENRGLMTKLFSGPFNWIVSEGKKRGEWDIQRNEIGMYESVRSGEWRVNTTRISNIDGTNVEDLTQAEIEGRKQAVKVFEFIKKNIPGCENAIFMDAGATVGIRETRHIIGEYIMKKQDIIEGRIFNDRVLLSSNSIDLHSDEGDGGEYITVQNGKWYSIPYRSLIPLKIDNLIIAGRMISATSEAASAFRVMPPCMAMGEAAGTAAALSVKYGTTPRKLNVKEVQEKLKNQGVFL